MNIVVNAVAISRLVVLVLIKDTECLICSSGRFAAAASGKRRRSCVIGCLTSSMSD